MHASLDDAYQMMVIHAILVLMLLLLHQWYPLLVSMVWLMVETLVAVAVVQDSMRVVDCVIQRVIMMVVMMGLAA